jgi:hypothetical protein
LEEADAMADEMQFDESFREEFMVKRGTYDALSAVLKKNTVSALEKPIRGW